MLAYRLMEKSNGDDLVCNCTIFRLKVSPWESEWNEQTPEPLKVSYI